MKCFDLTAKLLFEPGLLNMIRKMAEEVGEASYLQQLPLGLCGISRT